MIAKFLLCPAVLAAIAGLAAGDVHAQTREASAWRWADATASPIAIDPVTQSDREAELLAQCGAGDAGLRAVAERVVERKLAGLPMLGPDGLAFAQRAAGEPHVWPRAWLVAGRALDHEASLQRLSVWRASFRDIGERRCGVATAFGADGTEVIAAVALDALADLRPIPLHTHAGSWVTVDATMRVPASGARVVVVGPSGDPRGVPTSFDRGRVVARFAPERPGAFTVQVVADVATGPRPVLEAAVFADVEAPSSLPDLGAPGEDAAAGEVDARTALSKMIAALRSPERLRPLVRDARLDEVATAHARRMMRARTIGHDVGDGDPAVRLTAAGIATAHVGENVAHARDVRHAHRALYASPSHRANLLRSDFDSLGLGVIDDDDGSVWVSEIFASRPH